MRQEHMMEVMSQIEFDRNLIHQYETNRSEPNMIALYWDDTQNKFIDEGGYIVWNPEALVPAWMIQLFKAQKSYFYGAMHGGNTIIELFWPEYDDDIWDPENRFGSPPWNE